MYCPETMYGLRFDKHAHYGLELLWNHAMHVVTTKVPIETEVGNLNFVFMDDETARNQWEFLYSRLPLLLMYTCDIADALVYTLTETAIPGYREQMVRRSIGFETCLDRRHADPRNRSGYESTRSLLKSCPRCNQEFVWSRDLLRRLFHAPGISCMTCHHGVAFGDLIVDDG